jgi:hypothetical protein
MLRELGGSISMIQPAGSTGDERLFERQFFANQLQIRVFSGGRDRALDIFGGSLCLSSLPDHCFAVIDIGDDSLYFYISDIDSEKESDLADGRNAIRWFNSQRRFRDRSPFIFDKETIPLHLAILFSAAPYNCHQNPLRPRKLLRQGFGHLSICEKKGSIESLARSRVD